MTAALSAPSRRPGAGGPIGLVHRALAVLGVPLRPGVAHWLVLGCATFLLVFGLVMVLSASSVESYAQTGSPFSTVVRQAGFAAVGVPLALLAARLPVRWWRRLAWPGLLAAVVLQALVLTPLGVEVQGNRSWIALGPVTVQPAEAVKLALVVWVAAVLARKEHLLDRLGHVLVPLVPGVALPLGLVLAGHDVGSALVVVGLVAAMAFAAGVRIRHLLLGAAATAVVLAYFVLAEQHRTSRVLAWWTGECSAYYGQCWQPTHGQWALASGGWWGLGLGAGREKWAWLPEAHNDFIFAVIGEELGLLGATLVLVAFLVMVGSGLRIAVRTDQPFEKLLATGLTALLGIQAFIIIGGVTRVLPLTGVTLPFVSYGGSSLLANYVLLALLLRISDETERAGSGAAEPERAEVSA